MEEYDSLSIEQNEANNFFGMYGDISVVFVTARQGHERVLQKVLWRMGKKRDA